MIWTSFSPIKIKGIEIRIHLSWVLIYLLVVWSLRIEYFGNYSESLGSLTLWFLSALSALIFFLCLLIHELSHSLTARRHGIPIDRITMFIFGGVAHLSSQPSNPSGEVKMTIAGPAASFALAGVGFLIRMAFSKHGVLPFDLVIDYLILANVAVGLFNLLPGFPLDGGRLFRALLWKLTGNFVKATRIASIMGRVIGLALVFVGVTIATAKAEIGFLWLAFVGTFLERLALVSAMLEIRRYVTISTHPTLILSGWHKEGGNCYAQSWFSLSGDGHLLDQDGRRSDSSEKPEV
ncbi:MAG: site-2 protease family protein [bacterium]